MTIGAGFIRMNEATGQLTYYKSVALLRQRHSSIKVLLEKGGYYIVPITSATGFQKPKDAKKLKKVNILKKNKEFNPLALATLRDAFSNMGGMQYSDVVDHL